MELDPGDCAVCGAPTVYTSAEYQMTGAGYGPPGTECIVTFRKLLCAAGHRYDKELGSVEVPGMSDSEGGSE